MRFQDVHAGVVAQTGGAVGLLTVQSELHLGGQRFVGIGHEQTVGGGCQKMLVVGEAETVYHLGTQGFGDAQSVVAVLENKGLGMGIRDAVQTAFEGGNPQSVIGIFGDVEDVVVAQGVEVVGLMGIVLDVKLGVALRSEPEKSVGFAAQPKGAVGRLLEAIDAGTKGGEVGNHFARGGEITDEVVVGSEDTHRLVLFAGDPIAVLLVQQKGTGLGRNLARKVFERIVVQRNLIYAKSVDGP